jgi:hypothetical protein
LLQAVKGSGEKELIYLNTGQRVHVQEADGYGLDVLLRILSMTAVKTFKLK